MENSNLRNIKKYDSFDESKLYSPKEFGKESSIITHFKLKVYGYKSYYNDLVLLRTKCFIEANTELNILQKEMLEIMKSIIRFEDISFIFINNEDYEWKTTTSLEKPFKAL